MPKLGKSIGKVNDDVQTPKELLEQIKKEFGEFYDPCPLHADFDGLSMEWKTPTFVNPPFSSIRPWVLKALQETKRGVTVIMLLTARVNSRYWQELIFPNASEIRFIAGEVTFEGYTKGFPTPICLVIFKPESKNNITSHRYGPYNYTSVK
jgi:site-specific DNA-methyltransferase (adenine-specific)